MHPHELQDNLGLGIDAGGTQTRWALAAPGGRIVAEGTAGGLSALQMGSLEGRETVQATFGAIAQAVLSHGRPVAVRAGVTGFGVDGGPLQQSLGALLGLDPKAVVLSNDIEIAYLASFKPGEGYLVYSGTGSIGDDARAMPWIAWNSSCSMIVAASAADGNLSRLRKNSGPPKAKPPEVPPTIR